MCSPDTSFKARSIMNSFVNDLFAVESTRLVYVNESKTVSKT